MKFPAFLALFLMSPVWAGTVTLGDDVNYGLVVNYDDSYSFQRFNGQSLVDREMDGLTIYDSSFASPEPDTDVFPPKMTGATFVDCDLSNVTIPPGNKVIGGTQKRYKAQNDGEDWLVDKNNAPVKPIDEERFIKFGVSTDPKDIPAEMKEVPITIEKELATTK